MATSKTRSGSAAKKSGRSKKSGSRTRAARRSAVSASTSSLLDSVEKKKTASIQATISSLVEVLGEVSEAARGVVQKQILSSMLGDDALRAKSSRMMRKRLERARDLFEKIERGFGIESKAPSEGASPVEEPSAEEEE